MTTLRNCSFSLAVLGILCTAALTQAAEQAKFHLPVPARWGRTVLESGDYRLTLPDRSMGASQLYVRGESQGVFEMPMTTEDRAISSRSYVKLIKVDGAYFVEEYGSKSEGKIYTFRVPKTGVRKEMATRSETFLTAVK